MADIKYDIVEEVGVVSESSTGWTKELNLISWNNREAKYDLRDWAPDHAKMGKGITLSIDELNEDIYSKYLYQDLPSIDFLIRTSGENRVSNFMLWQISYAEFYFPKTYFPDFNEEEFEIALLEYNKRDRRFGGIKYENKNN